MKTETSNPVNEKAVFNVIGDYGPWQRHVFIIIFLVNLIGLWHSMAITFLAPNMQYRCVLAVTDAMPDDSSTTNVTGHALAKAVFRNSTNQCEARLMVHDGTNVYEQEDTIVRCIEWEYDTSVYSETIVSEWDLVCDREWMVSFAKSIYMIGFLASLIVTSQVSDCLGRRPTIIGCYIITAVAAFVTNFSNSYLMFVVVRFFLAFGRLGLSLTGYILLMEIIGPERRTDLGIIIQYGWCVGQMTLPLIALLVKHWYWQQMVTMIPIFPLVCMFWIIPESPRWLITQNRNEDFIKVVQNAAEKNGKKFGEKDTIPLSLPKHNTDENPRKSVIDLLRNSEMRKRLFASSFLWAENALTMYTLLYNTNDLGGNPYLNFFVIGLMDLLGRVYVYYSDARSKKRKLLVQGILVAAVCFGFMTVIPASTFPRLRTFLFAVAKFSNSVAFAVLLMFAVELFPTVVRNAAIGASSTCGRFGAIAAPFARELDQTVNFPASCAISAVLGLVAVLITLLLPETQSQNLPDTLEESEPQEKCV